MRRLDLLGVVAERARQRDEVVGAQTRSARRAASCAAAATMPTYVASTSSSSSDSSGLRLRSPTTTRLRRRPGSGIAGRELRGEVVAVALGRARAMTRGGTGASPRS